MCNAPITHAISAISSCLATRAAFSYHSFIHSFEFDCFQKFLEMLVYINTMMHCVVRTVLNIEVSKSIRYEFNSISDVTNPLNCEAIWLHLRVVFLSKYFPMHFVFAFNANFINAMCVRCTFNVHLIKLCCSRKYVKYACVHVCEFLCVCLVKP